jgi:preprotein translocase subunit SecF
MKDFSKATKIGLIIMIIAGLVMALLVIVGESVPDLVAWMFFVGLVISIASTFFVKKR